MDSHVGTRVYPACLSMSFVLFLQQHLMEPSESMKDVQLSHLSYAYAADCDDTHSQTSFSEPHYDFDAYPFTSNDEMYWEPSNMEDELKSQLQKCTVEDILKSNIQLVPHYRNIKLFSHTM